MQVEGLVCDESAAAVPVALLEHSKQAVGAAMGLHLRLVQGAPFAADPHVGLLLTRLMEALRLQLVALCEAVKRGRQPHS